jgi:peptidoglycan/LPS O-acetylase OafA/YrhL
MTDTPPELPGRDRAAAAARADAPARIAPLDGLRGIASMIVFVNHIVLTIRPPVFRWSAAFPPISFLWNGNFAVCIFFTLSGYVLSAMCSRSRIGFPAQAARRYLRLAGPILATSTFAWLLFEFGLYRNQQAAGLVYPSDWLAQWYVYNPGFVAMLKEALWGAFTLPDTAYARGSYFGFNSNLWTMQVEMIGSLGLFLAFALLRDRRLRAIVLLPLTIALHYVQYPLYYPLFAWGMLLHDFSGDLADLLAGTFRRRASREVTILLLAGLGCYLGSYFNRSSPWYAWQQQTVSQTSWSMIGAVLLVAAVEHSSILGRLFGARPVVFLGRISFLVYLLHVPLLCSFTSWTMLSLPGGPHGLNLAISAGATVALGMALSSLAWWPFDYLPTRLSRWAGNAVDARARSFVASLTPLLRRRPADGR